MVGSPLAAFTNSTERLIARKSYIDYCVILDIDKDGTDAVKCHSPDHPEYYNTVSIKIRSTKKNSTNPNVLQHVNALILQRYLGNCFGEPYNPRVGDLVAVLFMYNEKPLILGPIASIQQPPVMRAPTSEDAKYDYVNKWCQWLKPKKDKNYDFFDHPQGKMPVCFKRFHGPVTGEVGIGRDEMTVWDCQKGDADPTCSDCRNIDSVPRSGEQWYKIYSTQTESKEAYNSRMELHARCGSYFRVESDNTNEASSSSSEYSEEIGHIRLGNALTESDKRFHLNVQGNRYGDSGVGSFDLHTNHEEVQIASESTGVRFAAIRPEDSQVTWAYELMNFPTTSFIRCYKDGVIEINSLDGNSSITVDGTSNKVTVDGTVNVELIASSEVTCTTPLTHVTGNMQIDGFCSHNGCTCDGQGGGVVAGGVEGGQTICGDILPDGELTLRGTTDETKGTVKVDANLACTDNCQLPSICGSDQPDGELDLAGTSDASKGCVNVNSDLKCSSSVYGSDQPDGELVLKGTKDVSKGCVKVDADLACTGGCQLPSVCGSDQVDGELTLSGTSDASKGCVTVDSDLECTGALGSTIKSSIKSYCDGLYSSSGSGVTNGDSHDHSGGDGAQIDHGGLSGLGDDDHSIYLNLGGRTGHQAISGVTTFEPPNFDTSVFGDDFSDCIGSYGCFVGWNRSAQHGETNFVNHKGGGLIGGFGFYEYNQATDDIDMLMHVKGDGDVYIVGDLTADSYVDHTPSYDGDAIIELKQVTSTKGKIDHKTLPQFARTTKIDSKTGKEIEGRNIGNMVSILTKAVQQLTEKIETLENKINQLETP